MIELRSASFCYEIYSRADRVVPVATNRQHLFLQWWKATRHAIAISKQIIAIIPKAWEHCLQAVKRFNSSLEIVKKSNENIVRSKCRHVQLSCYLFVTIVSMLYSHLVTWYDITYRLGYGNIRSDRQL